MLEAVIIILLVLWLLGLITGFAGNYIYLLLVVALAIFAIKFVTGRKVP